MRERASIPTDVNIVVIGAGAAGIGAGRRLAEAGASFVILEARDRLGGRAHTLTLGGHPVDAGCGWLHSADRNPFVTIAEHEGFAVDRSPPRWGEQAGGLGYPAADLAAVNHAMNAFFDRFEEEPEEGPDRPAADLLDPSDRWSAAIGAVATYVNGRELELTSVRDSARYADTGVNWRVPAGYGALIAAHGRDLPVALDCPVRVIDHGGPGVLLETASGTVRCRAVIVTVSSNLIAAGAIRFTPDLKEKRDAAAGLPLGIANKVFLGVRDPDALPQGHVFAHIDRVETGSYHLKPFGRPVIEGYFGGRLARALEAEGVEGFAAFAREELAHLLGSDIAGSLTLLGATAWASDPCAAGSYSIALPGHADDRARLAAPVDGRLYFAGEATSRHDFSTAHGAYRSGRRAAEEALAIRG